MKKDYSPLEDLATCLAVKCSDFRRDGKIVTMTCYSVFGFVDARVFFEDVYPDIFGQYFSDGENIELHFCNYYAANKFMKLIKRMTIRYHD